MKRGGSAKGRHGRADRSERQMPRLAEPVDDALRRSTDNGVTGTGGGTGLWVVAKLEVRLQFFRVSDQRAQRALPFPFPSLFASLSLFRERSERSRSRPLFCERSERPCFSFASAASAPVPVSERARLRGRRRRNPPSSWAADGTKPSPPPKPQPHLQRSRSPPIPRETSGRDRFRATPGP